MQRVLVVFPTAWDRRQIAACPRLAERFRVLFAEPSAENSPWNLDVLALVDDLVAEHEGRIDGVLSSNDDPGAVVAAMLAARLGLPGPSVDAVVRSAHKLASREAQRRAAPDAVPAFARVDPHRPDGGLPLDVWPRFVKPIRGSFSLLARRIDDADALAAYLAHPAARNYVQHFAEVFETVRRACTSVSGDARAFLAEDVLRGVQVTVEGFVHRGEVGFLGVVDSVLHATGSFVRFDAPSTLPRAVQERMREITTRVVLGLGLDETLFNVELMHDPSSGAVHVIEVNPRMCGQFADLHEKLTGTNGYEAALDLATGRRPRLDARPRTCAVAASHPLRTFEPVRVVRAPHATDLRAAEALFPGTLCWSECESGQDLSDFATLEDGHSARYAIVNLGADDALQRDARLAAVRARLGFEFAPLPRTRGAPSATEGRAASTAEAAARPASAAQQTSAAEAEAGAPAPGVSRRRRATRKT